MGVAIGYLACQGHTVCVPLTDSQDYDLVVDIEGLKRVQVRTSTQAADHGGWEVGLRVTGKNTTAIKTKKFDSLKVDLVFIVCLDGSQYLIPSSEITSRSSICVGSPRGRYEKFRCG